MKLAPAIIFMAPPVVLTLEPLLNTTSLGLRIANGAPEVVMPEAIVAVLPVPLAAMETKPEDAVETLFWVSETLPLVALMLMPASGIIFCIIIFMALERLHCA